MNMGMCMGYGNFGEFLISDRSLVPGPCPVQFGMPHAARDWIDRERAWRPAFRFEICTVLEVLCVSLPLGVVFVGKGGLRDTRARGGDIFGSRTTKQHVIGRFIILAPRLRANGFWKDAMKAWTDHEETVKGGRSVVGSRTGCFVPRPPCGSSDRVLQDKLKLILFTTIDLLEGDGEPKCTSGMPNLVHDVVRFGRTNGGMGIFGHIAPVVSGWIPRSEKS